MSDTSKHISVPDTAFVTASFRAQHEHLSADPYSKLWFNPKTDHWVEEYLRTVSSEEPYTHSLRNRFFLDHMQKCQQEQQLDVVINFGCGFSMYPYLLPASITHVEIDKPEIVALKKEKVTEWQQHGHLPHRHVEYIGVDFSDNYQEKLYQDLLPITRGKSTFIILEGVLFFLDLDQAKRLFDFFQKLQKPGDHVACCSFRPALMEVPAYRRLMNFFTASINGDGSGNFLMLDDNFYTGNTKYDLIDLKDYFSMSELHHHEPILPEGDILNEVCYLLQRK